MIAVWVLVGAVLSSSEYEKVKAVGWLMIGVAVAFLFT